MFPFCFFLSAEQYAPACLWKVSDFSFCRQVTTGAGVFLTLLPPCTFSLDPLGIIDLFCIFVQHSGGF